MQTQLLENRLVPVRNLVCEEVLQRHWRCKELIDLLDDRTLFRPAVLNEEIVDVIGIHAYILVDAQQAVRHSHGFRPLLNRVQAGIAMRPIHRK